MKIALIALAVIVGLIVLMIVIGYALPVKHQAMVEREFAAPPSRVFAVISTPADFPRWRGDVKRVEMLPAVDGHQSFREIGSNGDISYVVDTIVPDRRLVTRIADKSLPFGGSWTYELTPSSRGTTLRVTENGEVYNPFFRFMSRFVFGHTKTIDGYLKALTRKLETST